MNIARCLLAAAVGGTVGCLLGCYAPSEPDNRDVSTHREHDDVVILDCVFATSIPEVVTINAYAQAPTETRSACVLDVVRRVAGDWRSANVVLGVHSGSVQKTLMLQGRSADSILRLQLEWSTGWKAYRLRRWEEVER